MSYDEIESGVPRFTTARLVHACEAAAMRLAALNAVLAPIARRTPLAAVPADLLHMARTALRPAARVGRALRAPPLLPLREPLSLAGLAARVALAQRVLASFTGLYREWHADLGDHRWAVAEWLVAAKDVLPPSDGEAGESLAM